LRKDDVELVAPWYLLVTQQSLPYFFNPDGSVREYFINTENHYYQNGFFLFYGNNNILLEI